MRRSLFGTGASLLLMLLLTAAAQAAVTSRTDVEDRWLGYVGCWRANDAPLSSLLCVVPEGQGVRMVELNEGAIVRETRIVADGQPAPISQEGCTGTERAHWSADGERVFLSTEMTCGERTARKTSGLFARVSNTEWVSVQALEVGDQAATRTVRYTSVGTPTNLPQSLREVLQRDRLARETARFAWMSVLDLEDVREAVAAVHPRAVEALVVARNQPVNLDGRTLRALAQGGVPSYVIDALVATSFPERFAVQQPEPPTEVAALTDRRYVRGFGGGGTVGGMCNSYDMFSRYDQDCYSRYGYLRYSPWDAYSPYGYNQYGYRNPPIIIRVPTTPESEREHGKVTKRGYSRGRSGGSSGESSSGSPSARSSDSGSSSGSSSSGSSGSGDSERRTAKPRGT
jgi:uncharacterized membrane protein YgcG